MSRGLGIIVGVGQTPAKTNVTDSSTTIIAANTSRIWLYIVNKGSEDVWASCDNSPAVLDDGIFLKKGGGDMVIAGDTLTRGAIYGICKSGKDSDVSYQEGVLA